MNRSAREPVLVVAAHPDDEALGCGGAMAAWAAAGRPVHLLILADGVSSRGESPAGPVDTEESRLRADAARRANEILGTTSLRLMGLPDNRLDGVDLLDVARLVEDAVREHSPVTIVTHHAGDLNVDHRVAHQAVSVAARPQPGSSVRDVLFFETPSSTEWRMTPSGSGFEPNWFMDISTTLDVKLEALRAYGDELREFPHPRSLDAVTALARWRGASAGVRAAEAFMLGRFVGRAG
jgi:N-acetylglucosamine malate deacetylase 1